MTTPRNDAEVLGREIEALRRRDEPLLLDEYQLFTRLTDQSDRLESSGLPFVLLGLVGEVGSHSASSKKKQRDKDAHSPITTRSLKNSATFFGICVTLRYE